MTKTGDASEQPVRKKSWLRRHIVTIILIAVLAVGLGLLLYPTVSDYWNSFHQSRAIIGYMDEVSSIDPEIYEEKIQQAYVYNRNLLDGGINWRMSKEEIEEYNAELDFSQNGIMGYIQIDKIGQTLPIYHGTSDAVLQKSIGHLEGSSLPVGCESFDYVTGEITDPTEGCHILLSGHRGLPSAKLFSDLDKLVEGDTFSISVLNETLSYQVDQIRIVLPEDLSDVTLEPGKDYCTLITCTPYGINTHRLLVRGQRIANPQGESRVLADATLIDKAFIAPIIAIPLLFILLTGLVITTGRRRRYERRIKEANEKYR